MKFLFKLFSTTAIGIAMLSPALADEPAKHNCIQPDVPGKFSSEHAVKEINKKTIIYKDCINKFAQAQQEISKTTVEVAKANAAHDAGEKAMQEFNDYIKLRNKLSEEE